MENTKPKWAFIVNPVAGNGDGSKIIPLLKENIERRKLEADIFLTEYPGHATKLSASAIDKGYKYIIGSGGDGTLNEIAKPLIGNLDITLGIIPAGSGNDFIQILGFPNRFEEKDWETFFRAEEKLMDTGTCNEFHFLNGMGLGFDAEVAACNYTEEGKVKGGGGKKYIWHIVKTLLFFREKRMTYLRGNEKNEISCFINTIANGRRFAGGFFLTPEAVADDGLIDVCMIKKINLAERFYLLLKVPSGTHIKDRRVNYQQVNSTKLEFKERVPFHVDGELHFANSFEVKVVPKSLRIIYNPDGKHFFRR
jgi:YegS/Rv2252/BmrU family lipid kinase